MSVMTPRRPVGRQRQLKEVSGYRHQPSGKEIQAARFFLYAVGPQEPCAILVAWQSATAAHDSLTVEEYLKLEESATVRHEYVGGEIFAMVGATKRHNRIIGNITGRLWGAARGGDCRVYSESVKLRVAEDVIYYPDVDGRLRPRGGRSARRRRLLVWW